MKKGLQLISRFRSYIVREMQKSGEKRFAFSFFIIINYSIPILITNITGNFAHDSIIYIRGIDIMLCIGMLFCEYSSNKFKTLYYPFYWYFSMLLCLPFTASYTIFITHISEFWLLNATFSILLLFILVDWISFAVMLFLGCVLSYICYGILTYYHYTTNYLSSHDVMLLIYIYGFMVTMMFFFISDKEKHQEKQLAHMELFGGAIAHEVNTPVAAIQMIALTVSDIMRGIVRSVNAAGDAALSKDENGVTHYNLKIPELEFKTLFETLPQDLLRTSIEAKKVVEVLLLLLKHRGGEYTMKHSMSEVITETLNDYLITEDKKRRVRFKKHNDFKFFGTKQYMKQIVQNLLDNAFKYAGDDAQITITIEGNMVRFQDNGVGIQESQMPNLFKPFHPKGNKGSGIGLAFCSILLHNMGASIECHSEYGKYTEFIMIFPAIK